MSPAQKIPLNGDWHVYRYNISPHVVLRSPETMLGISDPKEDDKKFTRVALFELSGIDEPVEVLMDRAEPGKAGSDHYGVGQETRADTWFGEFENFDFRWDRHADHLGILIGYAANRLYPKSRDAFVAVKSPRARDLRTLHDTCNFQCSYITPFARTRPSKKGSRVSIPLGVGNTFEFENAEYTIDSDSGYNDLGRKVTAKTEAGKKKLRFWLLPIDGPGGPEHPLAIGCYFHYHDSGGSNVPGNRECGFTFQLC